MTSSKPHILIIGHGIAGPALALFLKKANISCSLYEAHPQAERVGGGFALAPNGMRVLAALGLAERVAARGSLALENVFRNERGKVLARFPNADPEKYEHPVVGLRRAAISEILTDELDGQDIPVAFGKRLCSIRDEPAAKSVIAYFDDGTSAEGDLLIGTDGVHSAVRRAILPEAPGPEYVGLVGMGGIVPAEAVPSLAGTDCQSLNFTFGARGYFGYCGGGEGQVMWWTHRPREREFSRQELQQADWSATRRELLDNFRGFHEPVERLIGETAAGIHLNIYDIRSLPQWHQGRVLVIGDAAHAVSPSAGQGASMALEDAMYLAKLLRDASRADGEVFAAFQRHRRPRVERIVAEGRRRGSGKQSVGPLRAKIRELFLTALFKLYGVRGQDWMYSYRIDWNA